MKECPEGLSIYIYCANKASKMHVVVYIYIYILTHSLKKYIYIVGYLKALYTHQLSEYTALLYFTTCYIKYMCIYPVYDLFICYTPDMYIVCTNYIHKIVILLSLHEHVHPRITSNAVVTDFSMNLLFLLYIYVFQFCIYT